MHAQHLQQHTEKTCCVEALRTCIFLYVIAKELREQDKNSAKCFKCSSQIYENTEHGVYEKLIKVLKINCSTYISEIIKHG